MSGEERQDLSSEGVHITNREIYEKVIQVSMAVDHLVIDSRNIRTAQTLLVKEFKALHERVGVLDTFRAVVLGTVKVIGTLVALGTPILLFILAR